MDDLADGVSNMSGEIGQDYTIKKKYRADWLDEENRIFINKLN